jgi:hypothetical protein
MHDIGGWLWAFLGIVGVGGLAIALAYGVHQWRHRRKDFATRAARDHATRQVYRQGG